MEYEITIKVKVSNEDVKRIEKNIEIDLNEDAVGSALQGFLMKEYENLYEILSNNKVEITKVFDDEE